MIRWADKQRCWIEEGVYFGNKSLDVWIALKFNPGDSTALYSSADKGISILKYRAPTSAHLEDLRRQEEIWDATKGNATYVEVVKQAKSKDVSPPVHYFGELWSNSHLLCLAPSACRTSRHTPRRCVAASRGLSLSIPNLSLMTLNLRRTSSRMGSTCNSWHLRWKVSSC